MNDACTMIADFNGCLSSQISSVHKKVNCRPESKLIPYNWWGSGGGVGNRVGGIREGCVAGED